MESLKPRRLLVAALLLLGLSTPAWADISQLVQAVASIGVAAGFINPLLGLGIALVAGLYASSEARRKAAAQADANRAAYNASLQDRNVTVLRNDAPWQIVYGSPAPVGGALVAMFTSGTRDEFKHLVIVFAAHECVAIDEIYIEGDPLGALDANGWVQTGSKFFESAAGGWLDVLTENVTFVAGVATVSKPALSIVSAVSLDGSQTFTVTADGSTTVTLVAAADQTLAVTYKPDVGSARVNVQKHLSPGGVDTADAFLISKVPSQWTTAHKLSGYTYIVLTLDLNMARFQGGPPNVTARLQGKQVYDYRTATTIYSTNPALCTADFLRADYGFAAAAGQVDSAVAIAAANACDSQGFACHGALSTDASRDSNLLALEESMAGNTHGSGGVWRILAGAWTSPVMDLTDADLAAPIEVTQTANTRATRYNGVRGSYAPAAQLGVVTDYTPYVVSSYVTADGVSQWFNASFPFTASNAECQKLAAIAVERSRTGLTIIYPAHLRAWKLQPGDRVTVTNAELVDAAKTFRVQDWTHLNTAPVGLVLVEDVAASYTGTFSATDPTAPTSTLADPWARPAAPAALAAVSGTAQLLVNGDGSLTTRVLCSWTASAVRAVLQGGYSQIQWRLATALDDQWVSADMAPDASSTYLTGVKDGTNILIRVRFITGVGAQGTWATILHTVIGKTAAPEPFDVFTLLVQPDGTRQFNFGYTTTAKPADWQGAEIRYIPGTSATPTWDNMTPLQDSATFYTSSPIELNSPLAGTWTFACKSIDTSGNKSTYKVVNIDLPDRRLGNVFDEFFEDAEGWLGTKTSCHVQDGYLVADDSATWATLPATWDAWTRWVVTPASPIYYETPARDFGTVISGQLNTSVDADGTVTQELATSADGATWSAWSSASAPFASRYLKLRLTVAATGPAPIPLVRTFSYQINAPIRSEYINDVVISTLTGFYRTGVGDVRIPMQGVYSVLKRISVVIQDSSAGTWTWAVIDKTLTYGPRIQFRLNGTLADPAFVDFFIEGY